MKIILKISEDNSIRLALFDEKEEKDCLVWKDESSLSRLLLAKIDQLLRRNKIGLDKISGYKIISEVPENYTNYRIAKILLDGLMIGKEGMSNAK